MDELTDAEREQLGRRLLEQRAALEVALDGSKGGAGVVSLDEPIGRLSRMDAIQQQKMAQESRRKQALRLSQTVAAIAAFESDSYGDCRSCDEPIGFRRLSARPETAFCLACQGRRERR